MNKIFEECVEERRTEVENYKDLCVELDDIIESEDTTFAKVYDALMSKKYACVVTKDLWRYVFDKYDLPFSNFNGDYTAVLRYGNFMISVPLRDDGYSHMNVYFDFWTQSDQISSTHCSYQKKLSQEADEIIKRLKAQCLDRKVSIFEIITSKESFYAPILDAKKFLLGLFPYIGKSRYLLLKKSRDKYINEIIDLVEERKADMDKDIEHVEHHDAMAKAEYAKVRPKVDEILDKFSGSFYAVNIGINCP